MGIGGMRRGFVRIRIYGIMGFSGFGKRLFVFGLAGFSVTAKGAGLGESEILKIPPILKILILTKRRLGAQTSGFPLSGE